MDKRSLYYKSKEANSVKMSIQLTPTMAAALEKASYRLKMPRVILIRQAIDAKLAALAAEATQKATGKRAKKLTEG